MSMINVGTKADPNFLSADSPFRTDRRFARSRLDEDANIPLAAETMSTGLLLQYLHYCGRFWRLYTTRYVPPAGRFFGARENADP